VIYLYVLVAISVTNFADVTTIRYFDTHGECLEERYKLEKENNPYNPYIYDCWVRKAE